MKEPILSGHTGDMLKERNILEEWVWRTINEKVVTVFFDRRARRKG